MSFKADISKFIQKTNLRADLVLRKLGLDALRGLQDRSPVDTGRFRGNWRVGIDAPNLLANDDKLPTGRDAGAEAAIKNAKFGNTIHLTNNLKYAGVLEHGMPGVKYPDGRKAHSAQAPTGVLQNTYDDLKNKFTEALNRVDEL